MREGDFIINITIYLNKSNSHYPRQRVCGLFLIGVGITMVISTLLGNSKSANALAFIIGYTISIFGILINPIIIKKFAYGKSTPKQRKASNLSLILLAALIIISFNVISIRNIRLLWLVMLLSVGIHFIPFYLVHGKLLLILGILTIFNSLTGIFLYNISFTVFGLIDAVFKLIIGTILFKLICKN